MSGTALLEVRDVSQQFGGLVAVRNFDLEVRRGEIAGLIGPNGAGKTTLFNIITGFQKPTSGNVFFLGRNVTGIAPHRLAELGVVRTFQRTALFAGVTVHECVRIGRHRRTGSGILDALLRTPRAVREERETTARADAILAMLGLSSRRDALAGGLSCGEQRLVEIAIALAAEPCLLLLDEPAAGLNPSETAELSQVFRRIRDNGITVLLVEHDMGLVMNVCDRVTVMDSGRKIAEGLPREVQTNEAVITAYLGERRGERARVPRPTVDSAREPILRLVGVSAGYGRTEVLHDVSLTVNPGELVTLIGANGAGKSTLLRTISGLLRPTTGRIEFLNRDISRRPASDIVRLGLGHCPEGRRILPMMTVLENLEVGGHTLPSRTATLAAIDEIFAAFPRLRERQHQLAGLLSGGEQQMLAIGRALMTRPRLLLLDEPSLGLSPVMVNQVADMVRRIHASGTAVLLVEQNANLALSLADRAYVLETGRIVFDGPADALLRDDSVLEAYLGSSAGRPNTFGNNSLRGGTESSQRSGTDAVNA